MQNNQRFTRLARDGLFRHIGSRDHLKYSRNCKIMGKTFLYCPSSTTTALVHSTQLLSLCLRRTQIIVSFLSDARPRLRRQTLHMATCTRLVVYHSQAYICSYLPCAFCIRNCAPRYMCIWCALCGKSRSWAFPVGVCMYMCRCTVVVCRLAS